MEFDLTSLADLLNSVPESVRGQRLVHTIRQSFGCDVVGLLRIDGDSLRPVATEGLTSEALEQRFMIGQHPRLSSILPTRTPVHFVPDNRLPDPYDGLLEGQPGTRLPANDCMGISLYLEGEPWGVLTLHAFNGRNFNSSDRVRLSAFALIAEATIRVSHLEGEIRRLRLLRRNATDFSEIAQDQSEILGQDLAPQALLAEVDIVADSPLAILLFGEIGVGKERLAHRIHRVSGRNEGPFVHIRCASLPDSQAESVLFGHVQSAVSGADAGQVGSIEAAHGGTLFLDEVGDLSLDAQAKLLRTLQSGEVQRLGEDRPRKVDFRLITATTRPLNDAVGEGRFRPDLYHRLSVYPVHIPPLRDSGSDVLILARRFLELNGALLGVHQLRLSEAGEQELLSYSWPGNVRELEYVIGRAALRALSQPQSEGAVATIGPDLLALNLSATTRRSSSELGQTLGEPDVAVQVQASAAHTLRQGTEAFQREQIRQRLREFKGNWARTARSLGIDPSNLRKLATRLDIGPDETPG